MDPLQNPVNPYYLHPSENPGMILVSPALDGSNYHTWSRRMKRALLSKNKIKFINGEIQEPAKTDPLHDAWERCNMMVISWITRVDFGLTSSPTSVGLFLGGEVVSYKRTPPPPISMYQNILFSLLIEVVPLCGARRLSYFAELRSKFLSSFSIFNIQYY